MPYQSALKESGYDYKMEYKKTPTNKQKNARARKRNITWYNPPFDLSVKTNIGKKFFKILTESFPEGHTLTQIFNKNTIKLSYSCMPNIKSKIDNHNKKQVENTINEERTCNCREKSNCPLSGKCLEKCLIYQASVTSPNQHTETYIGLTETTFKARFANHKQSFEKESMKSATELSKYIWTLKQKNLPYNIEWKIMGKARAYDNRTKRCNLCTLEKFFIIYNNKMATLNKRSELISTCRHKNKFLLKYIV